MVEYFGKSYNNKTEAAKATYRKNMKCSKCNAKITYSMWHTKIVNNRLTNLDLCGKCIKSIATGNKNKVEKHYKYAITKIIRYDIGLSYSNKSLNDICIDIKDNHLDKFICNCGKNHIPLTNWNNILPNNTKTTVDENSCRIIDLTNWRCKSCSSKVNATTMNNCYKKLSDKDKQIKKNKLSKITKKQHKNFNTKYTMIKGLIKFLKNDKLLKELENCKTLDDLNKLYSEVHRILSKRLYYKNVNLKKYIAGYLKNLTGLSTSEIHSLLKTKRTTNYNVAWLNLIKEWYLNFYNQKRKVQLYYATVDNNNSKLKIGITVDITKRKFAFSKDSGCSNYKVIRVFNNRYQAAYVEFKLRCLYCIPKTEYIKKSDLQNVIRYVNNIHYNKKIKNELKKLGWKFN